MKVYELLKVVDPTRTAIEWIDKNQARSLHSEWIPLNWKITYINVMDDCLFVFVNGDFNKL